MVGPFWWNNVSVETATLLHKLQDSRQIVLAAYYAGLSQPVTLGGKVPQETNWIGYSGWLGDRHGSLQGWN